MSSTSLFLERSHAEVGLNAVADAFNGTVYSDVFNMKDYNRIVFYAHWGVGTSGTSTFTVQACDDTTPSNRSAVAFSYRIIVGGAAPGAVTAATSTGFLSTAGSNQIVEIEVAASALEASGYGYVQLKAVEGTSSARLGGIIAVLMEPRFAGPTPGTATT